MTTIFATMIEDSRGCEAPRLSSLHLRYPRFIHAELMTHRAFSRNARSSRAVPVETLLAEIMTDPVVPLHWGANQRGMQADRECDELVQTHAWFKARSREGAWLSARDEAVRFARAFSDAGYHKQVVNRLLEPFMHIDVLVTSSEWENFFQLRDHPAAEPHIQILAREIRKAMDASTPIVCGTNRWHLPYVTDEEREQLDTPTCLKLSVARCARISYRPFDGNASIEAEIARHDALVGSVPMHASPAEHQARPDYRKYDRTWVKQHLHGNLTGWVQYRKTLGA